MLVTFGVLFGSARRMVKPRATSTKESWFVMAGKSPRSGSTKKEAKLSLKDKRTQKREKTEEAGFLKPRKPTAK